jgi:ABC-type multidrug transport system fused ATPase/permease subunit
MSFRGGRYSTLKEEEKEYKRTTSDWVLGKYIISYLKEYKLQVIVVVLLILLNSVVALVTPQLMKYVIDDALGENPTVTGNAELLLYLTLGILGVAIITAFITIIKTIMLYHVGFNTIKTIRNDTFSHLQDLSMKYFDTTESGRLISKVTNDCDKINELMSGGVISSVADLITLVGIMAVMLWMNWELALWCFLIAIPTTFFISWIFKKRIREAYRRTRKTIANVTSNLAESINGVKVSKSFTREKKNIKEFKEINKENKEANIKVIGIYATTFPIFHFLVSLVTALVYFYGGWTIIFANSTIHVVVTVGTAIAFTQYIGNFFRPILNLTMVYNTFQSAMAATERIYELNHTEPAVKEAENAQKLTEVKGTVKFEDVTFGYTADETVFENFNLTVEAGNSLAIVGPTGAGKTTLTNLLARFYEIDEGKITIDVHSNHENGEELSEDINIKDVTLYSLREQMGIVLQDPFLFKGSIADNISLGKDTYSLEEIKEAAKLVNAHEFITRQPNDYETDVGERGGRLSLGQRQLVSFARAVLRNPKILILDEATSSVDPYTELLIKQAMEKLLENRTSFIVAHRLSTVRNANRIIVLRDGKIVEEGTNDELLSKKKKYYRLYQLQFKDQEEKEDALNILED